MKKIIKFLVRLMAIIIMIMSVIFFLYGTMKLAIADQPYDQIQNIPGLIIETNPLQETKNAKIIISVSALAFIFSIIGFVISFFIRVEEIVIEEDNEKIPTLVGKEQDE
ncbi:hypothetical protein [Anabaena sp. UHCC 0204]|uniref:hypothetical protein n=1 Tax=Anabaena sp. UHCC 0204 TaxID=2590009 RepID=UPI001447B322|nr:hypothetical protein [Anabaena sp. UHCC 0204]MTJ08616.1 hypothetical protein [Anabaena sp. UHCC 0204]